MTATSDLGGEYVGQLRAEIDSLAGTGQFPHAQRLLYQEIERFQTGRVWRDDRKMVDVTKEKSLRISSRVLVPVKEHPKFNFVGKLLGPKGNSLKRLQEETMTKMAILGRGSMRDKQKEEELRAAGDPKFSHLSEDLHVEVTAFAPPAEAYARMAYALTEVRRFLVPDYNDEIRQEQMREMQLINESGSGGVVGGGGGGGGGGGDPEGGSTSSGSPPLPVTARPPPANLVLPVTGLLPHPALRGLTPRSHNGLTPSVEQGPAMSRLRSAGLLPLPAAPQTADLTKQLTSLGGDVTDEAAAHAQHQFLELCNSMNGMNGMSGYDLSGLGLLDITRITTLPVSQFADFYAAAPNPEPDASLCRPGDLSLKMAAHHNKLHVRHDPYGRLLMKTS
ncbi:KH domain-containing, RNA-binding, signal transduction-associated protein 2-like [Amphibalanus amphitrite]|uniref:KH domain-containing, RNA-binding, signal transduction-associated protein 2-like n=1 Tax=Amphibalanus amphitrite TaxID=1232801 RepID=UPI001C91AEAB|nr:KH domain-containing, RNA-binding, signal transduction-associated protein 2-like [Amphibalanus amphitrite]